MDSLDSYKDTLIEISRGIDEKGEFKLMKWEREVPCSCHPETCCHFDEKVTKINRFKQYADGTKVGVS